jgi:hypothetical protein
VTNFELIAAIKDANLMVKNSKDEDMRQKLSSHLDSLLAEQLKRAESVGGDS